MLPGWYWQPSTEAIMVEVRCAGGWRVVALASLLAALVAGCGGGPQEAGLEGDVIAFVDVNVVPMDSERIVEGQTVLVQDGRITALGPSDQTDVPAGARRIDGRGNYLMPGLAEMHAHLPGPSTPPEVVENNMFLYVANGVTTARGMLGNPFHFEIRNRIDRGEILGPRLLVGGPAMSGGGVTDSEDAARLVREYKAAGFDSLKISEGLTPEIYDAIVVSAKEEGIPFAGHVPDLVGLRHALDAGQLTIDHLDNYVQALAPDEAVFANPPGLRGVGAFLDRVDEAKIPELVELTKGTGAWVVPTMVVWEVLFYGDRPSEAILAERPEVKYMPQETVDQWARSIDARLAEVDLDTNRGVARLRRKILRALGEGGVRMLLGTDSPRVFNVPGFSIHHEMQVWVEEGMTPFQILEAGSRNVAEYLDAADDFGTVGVGQRANLILVQGNPLEDIANVARREGVMVNGEWMSEREIQERLAQIAAAYAGR